MTKQAHRQGGKPKTRHLMLLLMREEFSSAEGALKDYSSLETHTLPADLDFEGSLHLLRPSPKEPRWAPFLREGLAKEIQFSLGVTSAAVLFVKVGSRLFAVTFGQGRHLLHPDAFEVDFGLKVTLNAVDATKLRSVDVRTFEETTLHTRRQVSRSSSLESFNVDVSRDLLGSVTGTPVDATLAKRLTGRDALAFTGSLEFSDLGRKCESLLACYKSAQYKERFPWVDNIRLVRSSRTIDELNERLVHNLDRHDTGKIHLAPPEIVDWESTSFLYPGESSRTEDSHVDLDLEDCLVSLAGHQGVERQDLKLSVEMLKREKIRTVSEDGTFYPERWPIYNCFVAELSRPDALYILSAGQWFKVEKTFAAQVLESTRALVKEIDHLPVAHPNDEEGAYNANASSIAPKNLVLFDKKNKKVKGTRTPIEPCDLFSDRGQFIHVKRKLRSSSLSHLFAQGVISAEAFLSDEQFRRGVRKVVTDENPGLAKLLGDPKKRPDPGKYEVVYAIIASSPKERWPEALPFFSQLNLDRTATRLKLLGFRVALYRIDVRA